MEVILNGNFGCCESDFGAVFNDDPGADGDGRGADILAFRVGGKSVFLWERRLAATVAAGKPLPQKILLFFPDNCF